MMFLIKLVLSRLSDVDYICTLMKIRGVFAVWTIGCQMMWPRDRSSGPSDVAINVAVSTMTDCELKQTSPGMG